MDSMYAFVETWITSVLNLEHEEYPLADGKCAHIIDQTDFDYITHFFQHICQAESRDEIGIVVIPSCVRGMRLLLMKYWEDESILYSLTDGDIKTHARFQIFMNLSYPRCDITRVGLALKVIARDHHRLRGEAFDNYPETVQHDVDYFTGSASPSASPKPNVEEKLADIIIPEPKNPGEQFINKFLKNNSTRCYINIDVGKNCVVVDNDTQRQYIDIIVELSKKIDKNIFFIGEIGSITLQMKKENITNVDMAKYTIIINRNPNGSGFYPGRSGLTICLGKQISEICKVIGNNANNKKINEINGNSKLTKEEKENKINEIYDKKENSPFFKYDCIFKDTYTGTIWAVRDRCFIYFLFEFGEQNIEIVQRVVKETGERFNMDIPYRRLLEIDQTYFREFSSDNLNEYVEFSLQSCKVVFNGIKNLLEEQVSLYKKYLSQAMECAKMVSKYQDQLAAFDMKAFEEKEKTKAVQVFNDTMAINKINAIFIKDGTVHVYTKNLYAKDERTNKWHDIGVFHITIGMLNNVYNVDNTVRIYNMKYQGMGMNSDMQAPHVFGDGHACHGNLAAGMTEAYKNRNLFDLVYQILIFLQTANTSDGAGNYVNAWPEVPERIALGNEEEATVYEKKSESEQKFDDMLADALPININVGGV